MSTLADMSAEERAECVGMWVSYKTPMGEHTAIYEMGSTLFEPGFGRFNRSLDTITPHPDLPRAWQPDGTPPQGEWEYAEYLGDHDGMTDVFYFDGDPTHRQWKSEWEEL